jgi:lipid II isoglutaminyl synthase (glutamine-hydrolysing)
MTLISTIAKNTGKVIHYLLTKFTKGGGSSLPGKVALSIDKNLLRNLAKNYDVIVITGTNGKTLTTTLTTNVLSKKYNNIITNRSGSNMKQGIVGAFLNAPRTTKDAIAVLEVDEGSLKNVVAELQPKLFVHTNIFSDQLDRYGTTDKIYELLLDAAREVPDATIIANGDLPLFNSQSLENPQKFFGFDTDIDSNDQSKEDAQCPKCGNTLNYNHFTYANLGDYYCPSCGFTRPELDYKVTDVQELDVTHSTFKLDNNPYTLHNAGIYNIYNALAAYSVGKFFDVPEADIKDAFNENERVFGRQEVIIAYDKKIILNVVKNPVGLDQVLNLVKLEKEPFTLVALLNNRPADGVDLKWLEDTHFESLTDLNIQKIVTGGIAVETMTDRLVTAGFDRNNIDAAGELANVIEAVEHAPTTKIHMLATYTAMLEIRKALIDKGHIK